MENAGNFIIRSQKEDSCMNAMRAEKERKIISSSFGCKNRFSSYSSSNSHRPLSSMESLVYWSSILAVYQRRKIKEKSHPKSARRGRVERREMVAGEISLSIECYKESQVMDSLINGRRGLKRKRISLSSLVFLGSPLLHLHPLLLSMMAIRLPLLPGP